MGVNAKQQKILCQELCYNILDGKAKGSIAALVKHKNLLFIELGLKSFANSK